MRSQERTILEFVNLLLHGLHEQSDEGRQPPNAEAGYNWTTFDITGSLIFGEAFGCIQGSQYNPWIEFIMGTIKWGVSISALSYLGFDWAVQILFRLTGGNKSLVKTREYNDHMMEKRLAMDEGREDDLFEGLAKRRQEWNLSFEKLTANSFILILAGSKTTATALTGTTYLLLKHPEVLGRLQREVRSAFSSVGGIKIASVNRLSYMLAVLNESLRMYPLITASLVRIVPPGGAEVGGHFIPGGVSHHVHLRKILQKT